jgi:hypothetical protein
MWANMDVTVPLDQMSIAEKLGAMEALRADLSDEEGELESPVWQGQVLQERHDQEISGKESSTDWGEAKNQLRKRLQ